MAFKRFEIIDEPAGGDGTGAVLEPDLGRRAVVSRVAQGPFRAHFLVADVHGDPPTVASEKRTEKVSSSRIAAGRRHASFPARSFRYQRKSVDPAEAASETTGATAANTTNNVSIILNPGAFGME